MLHRKFKDSLGYVRTCLKKTQNKNKQTNAGKNVLVGVLASKVRGLELDPPNSHKKLT